MENKLRRGLALLMTLIMLISCAPMDALAAIVPVSGGTQTSDGLSLLSIVKPPVATVTYVFMNGTEEFARQILKNGQTLNNPGTPKADNANKEFVGWFDESGNQLTFPITASVGNVSYTITVNAQFADVYFVFFTNPSGEVMVTKKDTNGKTVFTEGVTYPVGNEESLIGWNYSGSEEEPLVDFVKLDRADVTLKAVVKQGHWITFDSQGGTYVEPAFVKGNGTTTAPAAPTRPGYTFRHWSATEGGAAFTFGNALTTALTLYAVWTPNTRTQYTVIHWQENANDDDYSFAESETQYGTTGAQTSAAAKSYTGFTAQTIAQQTIAGDGSTIVNVYYKRNVYDVKFYRNTGSESRPTWVEIENLRITAKYDAGISDKWPTYNKSSTWSTTNTYSGNWLEGYSLNGPFQVNINTMPLNGAKFYGPKTGSSSESAHYYVEVLPGESGDTTVSGVTYKLHHTDTSPGEGYIVTEEDRYPITGFTLNKEISTKLEAKYNNAKFYYTRNSYDVVYINNGVTVKTTSYYYEQSISDAGSYTPARPSTLPDTFTFGGWYADPAGGQAYTFTGKTMPAQNVTVYAKWNEPTVNGTAHIKIDGTDAGTTLEGVKYGGTITEQLNALQETIMKDKTGYTWRGWRTGPNGTGEPFNVDTKIYSDITLFPYYTKDGTFTVKYVTVKDDVTAPVDTKAYAEDSFADLMSPGKLVAADGEYFLGWYDGTATYQPRDKYQIKSNHANKENVITLTAQWGARPAGTTLTYKSNGGTGEDMVENLANNATVTTIANPFSRVGYTFKGWDTDPEGEGSIAPNTQVQVDNKDGENVLYAIWTANTDTKYTVEFYYQNTDGTYPQDANKSVVRNDGTTDTTVSVKDSDKLPQDGGKYVFDESNANNVLSGVVAGNGSLVLKLYFKLNTASYTIHHYLNGTTVKVADDQTGAMTIGEELTANKSNALYLAYAAADVASYAPSQTITIAADESENVITVYYTMPLTIKAKDASKTYDGDPLTQPDFTMEGLVNGDTKENFSLSMTAASTITNAGSTPNVIDTATVKYNNGGEIPSYYNVSYKPGTLTVTPVTDKVTVTVTENSAEHTYDGNEHSVKGYASMTADNTLYDVTKSVKATETAAWTAKGTDAGEYPVGVAAGDFENTNKNFTNVTFNIVDGVLKINPITAEVVVTVTENGAIVTYDGTEHSVKGYKSMTADNKLYDVTKSVKATETAAWTAKGKDAGDYPVGIVAGDFENTNKNFTNVEFVIVDGVLKINPITENKITITANSASKTYDGTPLTDIGFTFTEGVLADGDVLTAVVEGSATNVGDPGVNKVTSYVVTRGNKDVTGNYTFTDSVDGKLTINKRTVTLTSETASKEYDGTPLTKPEVAVTGDGFVAGEVSDITATGSVIFVHEGEVTNTITYTTGEKFNADNYTITKNEGKLSITQRTGDGKTITVTANSDEKVYDGAPLTNNGFTHAGALVEGDVLTAVVEGSQTDVGVGDNVVKSYKVMRGDVNVTTSYTFTDSVKGALTVTLRDVTFTGESKSLPYTGGMQSITGITQSGLVEGHRYEGLTYKAEGQNVDSYDGAFSGDVVIKDAQGNDVTKNYNVTKTPGKLTITNASFTVTFTGESDTKVYNGIEQSIIGITVDGLKPGHRYENLTYAAKGTDKGEYKGAFTGTVKILDENNVDVTENYAITQTPGKLTITAVETEVVVTIEGDKKAFTYDGTEHSAKNYKVVRISNELYKEKDFTFTGTAEVKGTNANTYPMGLKEGNFQNTSNNFKNVRFVVTDGELVINKRPVKVTAEKLEYAYNYANPVAHPAEGVARCTVEAANGNRGLLAGDALNADVLYDGQSTQTLIGVYQAVAQIAAAKITNADGDVTANYTIEKVDSTLTIKGNDPIDPGKETTSVQTNYTVGDVIEYKITVKNVSKDEATNVVVTDSMAEIQDSASYTVSDDRHTATIASIPAGGTVLVYARHTVTAEDVENAYAGDANGSLTNVANIKFGDWNKDVEGDHDKLNDTYEYVVRYYWNNYTSVQPHEEKKLIARVGTEVTEEPAAIEGYTPVSADSRKLTISADQSKNVIEFYYYKNVALTANSKTETYDGTVKSVSDFTIEGENKDQDDQTIAADFSAITVGAQGIDAGEYPADFAENTVGTVDATGRYIVTAANNGKLVINPVTGQLIIITANSARKTYDGTPLTDNGFTFTEGVLADGDVLTAVVEGSATNVGDEGKNVVKSYAVKRGETDVTKNYTFGNSIDGKLTINKRKVTLKSADLSKTYDGTPLVNGKTALATEDGFVSGEGATYTFTGSQTVVGSSANAFTYTLNEGTNAGNYEVAKTEGTLTVTQNEKAITITANSHTWEYDGQAHSDGGYTVEYDGKTYKVEAGETATLPTGDVVKAKITKTVTNVSDSAAGNNTIDELTIVNAAGEDTKGQYKTVTLIPGTLTITKRGAGEDKVKITAADNTVEYDGRPHGAKLNAAGQIEVGTSYTVTNLAEGHSVKTLAIEGSETDAGVYADKLVPGKAVIVDGNGVEVTANYDITYVPGTLTITKRGAGDMKVVLTAADNTVVYDGQSHGAKLNAAGEIELGTSYTTARLVEGHYVDKNTLDITGSQMNVGVYEEELKPAVKAGATRIVIRDKDGNDVTDNYALTLVNATLTITGDKLIPDKKAEDENIESNYKLGDEIEFTITVKNVSIYDVENVTVTDANAEIKAGNGYTVSADKHTATIAIIAAKSEIRIKALHTVTSEDILAGKVGNVANVEWKDGETTVTKTVDDDTTKLTPPNVTLNVTKTSDWEGKATGAKPELGTKITYTITVKNDGNVPYTNVNFTDLLQNGDASVTGEIPTYGTLPVNEEKSFTVEYIVTEADLLKESINNKVTAEADEIEYTYYEGKTEKTGKATPKGEAEVTDRTDDAKASTISTKTTTSKPKNEKGYELGETITYDIVVTNDGNLTVTDIEVKEELAGAVIKESTDGAYTVDGSIAKIAELKPGQSVTVKVEYVVTEADILAGSVKNEATVTGKGPDDKNPDPDKPGTEDPTDTPKAELNIEKSVLNAYTDNTPFKLGEKIEYQLTITTPETNNVTVKDVKVTDTLLTKANEGKFEITSLPEGAAAAYDNDGKLIITMPNIDPGKHELVIKYTYTVQETDLGTVKDGKATLGTVHNAATVAGTTDDPKVIPGSEDGNDVSTVAKLTITANDNSHVYDGKSHGARLNDNGQIKQNVSYTLDAELLDGHEIESVDIPFTAILVGVYDSEETGWLMPENAKIITAGGEDVTSKYYKITYVPGTLTITASTKELKIVANSTTWTYNGEQHTDGGYTVTYGNESYTVKAGESATLSTGDKVTAVVKGQVKDVDDTKAGNNEIVEWSVEHRDFYNNVTPANGTLTITPRKVTLKSDGGSKKYDGTPLTKPEVTVTGDGFVVGEVTGITATGSVTYVSQGEVDNLITFTKNEGFKDSNYEIKEIIGKLSIEALDVTIIITGPSAIREYKPGVTHTIVTGGSELDFVYGSDKVDGKIGVEGMLEGDKILPGTLKHTLEGMYVGEYEGVFTLFDSNGKKADKPTVMHDGVDVTENYKFSYNPGKLTITGKHMDGGKEVENEVPEKNYLLGQKIPFTITVRSVSKDELKDVTVTDPTATILPDRNTANPAYTVSEDEHTATITSLAPEAEVIVYAEHEVTEDDIINRYTNEATINWGNDEVKVSKTPSIEEENPEAELVKEIVLQDGQDENHKFKLGETVYFKITVTNTGNVTLNEYEVKEVLPGAAFIDGTGYTLNNDKTVATIEKMEPVKDGQEAPDSNQIVLYAQYNIKEEDLGNKELKNIVTADNSKPGEVPIPVDEAKSVSGQKIWKDEGNAFNTRPASITLTLMRKLGQNGAAEQYRTMQLGSNGSWRYSFDHLPKHDAQENEYFYWVVEEPVTGYDTAYETKDESHCDIVNNLQTYTLTIHYWQHKLGDTKMEQAFPDYVATLYYKQPYDVESPEREGIILDDMSQARISGTMPAHDLVIDVYYHRIAYRLTIHYIYQDGTMAHEDYTWTYWFNSTYNVPSPIIPGFTPSIDVIAGRMPSHGLELTVVYVGDSEIVIPDEDTSLGFKSYLNAGECFE